MDINHCHKVVLNMLFIIALAFQIIPIKSQIIDNIIRLAPNPYRYNHISFNSEGDMVIDIESYPLENNRKFYGIKKMEENSLPIVMVLKLIFIQWNYI